MRGHLLLAQNGFKAADQVGRTDNPLAQPAQKFDRSGVHHRDVHDGVIGRVLHGHGARSGQHRFQPDLQLLPARIERLCAGQPVQPPLLDAMHQLARFARGGHKVVPAPGNQRLLIEVQNARGDGVAMMVVVKEPPIQTGLDESRLHRREIRPGILPGMRLGARH